MTTERKSENSAPKRSVSDELERRKNYLLFTAEDEQRLVAIRELATQSAATVVERARAGSIILLHDGLDGDPSVDRTVLVRALPAILDGLRAKGLEVVSLDRLIGGPAYLPAC